MTPEQTVEMLYRWGCISLLDYTPPPVGQNRQRNEMMKLSEAINKYPNIYIATDKANLSVKDGGNRWLVYTNDGAVYYSGKDEEKAVDALINGTVYQNDGTVARKGVE